MVTTLHAYEVWPKLKPEWAETINQSSRGKAKHEYYRSLIDSWPDIPFTELRCRKIGRPTSSEAFLNNAAYRGMPNLRCGDRVRVGESWGTVAGHNCSANLDVVFDDDAPKYAGLKLNVHPQGIDEICKPN